jgi:ABC-type antimicrobial peptide transport system permease subunit
MRVRIAPEDPQAPWLAIVGVVPNIQHDIRWGPGGAFPPVIYVSISQQPIRSLAVAFKGVGTFADHTKLLRDTVSALDADLPVFWLRTIEAHQAVARGGYRLLASILVGFAGIAIVLAGVGIYGVLAFATAQRSREIGVRRALGARNRQIIASVARSSALQLAVGLGLGLILSLLMPSVLGDGLNGAPIDKLPIYTLIFSILIVTAALASWIPTLRALRIEPATALRYE